MATNPLFNGIGQRRSFSYRHTRSPLATKTENFAFIPKMSVGNGGEDPPPDKRRRVTENTDRSNVDQLWDDEEDDFCLTQDQLEDLEMLASQSHIPVSVTQVPKCSPPDVPSSQTSVSSRQTNVIGGSQIGKGKGIHKHCGSVNTSTSSRNYSGQGLSVNVQSSLRGHPVQSNIMLPMDDPRPTQPNAGDIPRKKTPAMVNSASLASGSGKTSPDLPSSDGKMFPDMLHTQTAGLKEEIASLKLELSKTKEEQYGKDGQIKILRNNLTQKEAELSKVRQEKVHLIDHHAQERSEKEKLLQVDVDKLTSQLQFKEREIQEIQKVCKNLEQRLKGGVQGSMVSPRLDGSVNVSPGPSKKVKTEEESPPRAAFPTSLTFHSPPPGSQRPRNAIGSATPTSKMILKTEERGTMTRPETALRGHRMKLRVDASRGQVSGSLVLSRLMVDGNHSMDSLVGLLNVPPAATVVNNKQDRQERSTILSPLKLRKTSKRPPTPQRAEPVVTLEHLSLAAQAMRDLLKSNANINPSQIHQKGGETLILPILEDYLACYINLKQNSQGSGFNSPANSRGVSLDGSSSVDSLSSSFKGISLTRERFSGWIEKLTLNALRILHKLVCYSKSVQQEMMKTDHFPRIPHAQAPDNNGKSISKEVSVDKPSNGSGSGTSTSGNISTGPSSGCRTSSTLSSSLSFNGGQQGYVFSSMNSSCLLDRVMHLANPVWENDKLINKMTVEASLDVLIALSRHCERHQLKRLLPVLTKGTLFNCLCSENKTGLNIVSKSLELLRQLISSKQFVTAHCTHLPDSCILTSLYNMLLQPTEEFSVSERTRLRTKIVELLCEITSCHPNGTVLLMEAKCPCSMEVVRSVVLMMHSELEVFRDGQEGVPLPNLFRSGVSLLHALSDTDRLFEEHRKGVGHQYLDLLSALSVIFKGHTGIPDTEVSALKDLLHEEESEEDD